MTDFMIPVLKRYPSLSRSGITTKGIDMGSAFPQPGSEHAEESANICSELMGAYMPQHGLTIPHPLSFLGSSSPSSVTASPAPPGTLKFPHG